MMHKMTKQESAAEIKRLEDGKLAFDRNDVAYSGYDLDNAVDMLAAGEQEEDDY